VRLRESGHPHLSGLPWHCTRADSLAAAAGHRDGAQVTAAVLLYRAVTYLLPIPLGAIACLAWRHAPALIHAKPAGAAQPAEMSPPVPDPAR
jgi:hypothetical protein